MRKFVLGALAAGAGIAVATPAVAQYYQPYGYGRSGYGYNGSGYNNAWAQTSGLERRLQNVMRSLDGVRPDRAQQIRAEAYNIDRQLRYSMRNGLSPYEAHAIDVRIGRLEQRLQYASGYGRGRYGYSGYNGYNGSNGYNSYNGEYGHRDRDRDDRWEDDRDHDRDD
jgi:hypothetical protein